MPGSLILLPLRLGIRATRVSLLATRDLAELGLATLDRICGETTSDARPVDGATADPVERAIADPVERGTADRVERVSDRVGQEPAPRGGRPTPAPPSPAPVEPPLAPSAEAELVEEVADPGAEDGAGASLRVAPPFAGYDNLRAPDVIARLGGADMAELGETELYERTHRARRTVLDAIAREIKRRPPNWVDPRT